MGIRQIIAICFELVFAFLIANAGVTVVNAIEAKGPVYGGDDLYDIIGYDKADFIEMNAKNFAGFYYGTDGGISTEYLRIYGGNLVEGRTIFENGLEYVSMFSEAGYDSMALGDEQYPVTGFLGDLYVPLGDAKSLKLAKLVFNDGAMHTLRDGQSFELGDGYTITPVNVDVEKNVFVLEILKDGKFIDNEVIDVSNGEVTWFYKTNIENRGDVEVMRIRVTDVFQDRAEGMVVIEGIWLLDFLDIRELAPGNDLGVFNVYVASFNGIVLRNNVPVTLTSGSVQELTDEFTDEQTGDLKFVVTDSSDYLEFYLSNGPAEPDVFAPDLVIVSADRWSFSEHEESLALYADIANQGNQPSESTSVHIEDNEQTWPDWSDTAEVPAMDPGDMRTVRIILEIPEEERDTTHSFTIEVDPDNHIEELDENNNILQTPEIFIPPFLSDLTIAFVESFTSGDELEIFIYVENQGDGQADEFIVTVGTPDQWYYSEKLIFGLAPGEDSALEILLEIPEDERETIPYLVIEVDPENDIEEQDEGNNVWLQEIAINEGRLMAPDDGMPTESSEGLESLSEPESSHWVTILEIIFVGTIVIGGIFIAFPRLVRIKWEVKAIDKCPEECPEGTEYCLREISDIKPGSCKITKLCLKATVSDAEDRKKDLIKRPQKTEIEGDIISELNRIRASSHRAANPDMLLNEIEPLAFEILENIKEWLAEKPESFDVSISADIDLGEATCKYTRFICDPQNKPEKKKSWEKAVKGCNRNMGTLDNFNSNEPAISEKLAPAMTRMIMQFIEGI